MEAKAVSYLLKPVDVQEFIKVISNTITQCREDKLLAEQRIPMEANIVVDTTFLPDFPRQKRDGQALELGYSGSFQVLCYGADGQQDGEGENADINNWE